MVSKRYEGARIATGGARGGGNAMRCSVGVVAVLSRDFRSPIRGSTGGRDLSG